MIPLLALVVAVLSAADHWTTWLCLRAPVSGWTVTEANPIADWLFRHVGLVEGLALDSLVTVIALAFLVRTRRVPPRVKLAFLCLVIVVTGGAVVSNVEALEVLGLSLAPSAPLNSGG
jgi:hypothetical protein